MFRVPGVIQVFLVSSYCEGPGDFVSRQIMGIIGIAMCLMGTIRILAKTRCPPSTGPLQIIT